MKTPEDELRELQESKDALDSQPDSPGNQIESIHENTRHPRPDRLRANKELAGWAMTILILLALLFIGFCSFIVES